MSERGMSERGMSERGMSEIGCAKAFLLRLDWPKTQRQPLDASWHRPRPAHPDRLEKLWKHAHDEPLLIPPSTRLSRSGAPLVQKEIEPFAHEWDEAGEFPRALYRKASEIGLLGLGSPRSLAVFPRISS